MTSSAISRATSLALALAALLSAILWTGSARAAEPLRDWTVMVYMNGKNNLEPNALDNFNSMAQVGSSSKVNFVVQLGRPRNIRYSSADGNWSGVYRFHVRQGTQPRPQQAVFDVAQAGETEDMGSAAALRNFVGWAKTNYPARRYMLVIWNHGQGWRFQLARPVALRVATSRGTPTPPALATAAAPPPAVLDVPTMPPANVRFRPKADVRLGSRSLHQPGAS